MSDARKYSKEKETKRNTLLELVEYTTSGSGKFTEPIMEDLVFMIK